MSAEKKKATEKKMWAVRSKESSSFLSGADRALCLPPGVAFEAGVASVSCRVEKKGGGGKGTAGLSGQREELGRRKDCLCGAEDERRFDFFFLSLPTDAVAQPALLSFSFERSFLSPRRAREKGDKHHHVDDPID